MVLRYRRGRYGCLVLLAAFGCAAPGEGRPGADDGAQPPPGDVLSRPVTCPLDPWVTRFEGAVVDEAGAPVPDARAQLCVRLSPSDELQCVSPARADAGGAFAINVPTGAQCMRSAVLRVLLPDADRVTPYCEVELPADVSEVTVETPFVLHATTRALALPPLGDESVARTVAFAGGLEVDVTPARYYGAGDGYAALAARQLGPSAPGLCFLDSGSPVLSLWAFSPEGDVTGAAFPLRLPNATALDAAISVDLYLLGGLSCILEDGTHVPEGAWVKYGTGTVSSDGTRIEGGALPCFTWVGYAPH